MSAPRQVHQLTNRHFHILQVVAFATSPLDLLVGLLIFSYLLEFFYKFSQGIFLVDHMVSFTGEFLQILALFYGRGVAESIRV